MTSQIQNIPGPPDFGQTPSAPTPSGGAATSGISGAATPASTSKAAVSKSSQIQDAASASDSSASTSNQNPSANLRLVIEDDKKAGCFVYKIVNRVTGEIVQQTPQEQIVKLRESDGYLAGDVIKAQA